jgi:hypothetical protein
VPIASADAGCVEHRQEVGLGLVEAVLRDDSDVGGGRSLRSFRPRRARSRCPGDDREVPHPLERFATTAAIIASSGTVRNTCSRLRRRAADVRVETVTIKRPLRLSSTGIRGSSRAAHVAEHASTCPG